MSNKPIKMHRVELAGVFKDIAASIEAGDSFEGSITYSCIDNIFSVDVDLEELTGDEFFVGGMYRVGNSMGQGGVNFLWEQTN
ncbi:hypothetical protein [Streptomyces hebeiensis]